MHLLLMVNFTNQTQWAFLKCKSKFRFLLCGQTSFTQGSDGSNGMLYFYADGAVGALVAIAATAAVAGIRESINQRDNSDYFTFKINYKKGNSILYSMPKR